MCSNLIGASGNTIINKRGCSSVAVLSADIEGGTHIIAKGKFKQELS